MSEPIDLKNHPTVKALGAHQVRLRETDVGFAKRYLRLSGSTWGLIKSGNYANMVQDLSGTLETLEAALRVLADQMERSTIAGDSAKILRFAHVRAALTAVKECYGQPQNRLVVYLAPTGGGKTTLARALGEEYLSAVVRVEATEAWRKSYFASGAEIARSAGLQAQYAATQGPAKMEADLLTTFSTEGRILVVDEGHYCGPQALNLLKFLLNRTTCRVVLLAIPELWQRMEKGAFKEVEQLRRRTAAKVVLAKITMEEAAEFLTARLPGYTSLNGEKSRVTQLCCDAANGFGMWDTLDRICTEFVKESGGRPATVDLVKSALKRVEALRS